LFLFEAIKEIIDDGTDVGEIDVEGLFGRLVCESLLEAFS
jgi:hypothetical protein